MTLPTSAPYASRHHLQDRARYFANVMKYLRPDGRIAIVEFNGEGWIESLGHHTSKEVIRSEMKAAGYKLEQDHGFLPRQHFLIFSIAN